MKRSTVLLAVATLIAGACSNEVDRAAKRRIFSPEDPPRAIAAAAEKIAADRGENPVTARRILSIGAAEATERLGSHKLSATLKLQWSVSGEPPLELTETRTLIAGTGGVGGDFHASLENSRQQGFDVMRVQGTVYAKSRFGKYRQRLRDRGMAEREREEVFSVLKEVDSLFGQRIKLTSNGSSVVQGRPVQRYGVTLANTAEAASGKPLPDVIEPAKGLDRSSARRDFFFEKKEPRSLTGEIFVDAETAVVLKATLDGRIVVPPNPEEKPPTPRKIIRHDPPPQLPGQPKAEKKNDEPEEKPFERPSPDLKAPVTIHVTLDQAISDIGKAEAIKPPKDFLPDEDKPLGIASALERFGIERSADGGTTIKGAKTGEGGEGDDQKDDEAQ